MKKTILTTLLAASMLTPAMAGPPTTPTAPPSVAKMVGDLERKVSAQRASRGQSAALTAPYTASAGGTFLNQGWYYARAQFCGWLKDSSGNQVWYIIDGPDTIVVAVNDPFIIASASAACADGHYITWHVIDQNTGAFEIINSRSF